MPARRSSQPRPLEAAAHAAARAGFAVFPLRPGSKTPAVTDWEHVATRNPLQIRTWWARRPYNIGIATGPSNLLVVDLDDAHGATPPPEHFHARHGLDVFTALAATAGTVPPTDTLTVATPSGGQHLYFRQPPGVQLRNSQARLGWRIDTRGHGGYVVAPGSRTPLGHYRASEHRPIAALPDWLIAALTPPPPPLAPRPAVNPPTVHADSRRLRAYVRAVVEGECARVAAAPVGTRHTTLLRAARRLGHWIGSGALTETDARAALTDAAAGYLGVAGYTPTHISRDINDGLAYGTRQPRRLPDRLTRTSREAAPQPHRSNRPRPTQERNL